MDVDLTNRDPNNINDHLKVSFEDVFGEPEGVQSFDIVWKLSYCCFNFWLGFTYKCATLCCGICIAAEWGMEFAYITFYHVWYITPLVRVIDINCALFKKLFKYCTGCCIEPCCESCGAIFTAFKK